MTTLSEALAKHVVGTSREIEVGTVRRQAFVPELRAVNEPKRQITFVASTETPDRFQDIIRVRGWDFHNYLRNPVVLFAHKAGELPVGKTVEIHTERTPKPALVHTVEFANHPQANQVLNLYRGKFLNAVSVGFRPTAEPKRILNAQGSWEGGYEFDGTELLEISCVPVPAQPEAVQRAVSSGVIREADVAKFFTMDRSSNGSVLLDEINAGLDRLEESLTKMEARKAAREQDLTAAIRKMDALLTSTLASEPYKSAITKLLVKMEGAKVSNQISSVADLEKALRGGAN